MKFQVDTRQHVGLNPFFIRSAVEMCRKVALAKGTGLNPFFIRSAVEILHGV